MGIYFDEAEASEAADRLRCLGGRARRLLEQCVESQGERRSRASATAEALETAGFILIREEDGIFSAAVEIRPTLAGEEALEALEAIEKRGVAAESAHKQPG